MRLHLIDFSHGEKVIKYLTLNAISSQSAIVGQLDWMHVEMELENCIHISMGIGNKNVLKSNEH